ncbi:MAG: outer membrane protein transport protein [Pseudoxanthomonas sp.]|nr:outer membrane protein transport protein [Pseudoxanthomonas sp.]
MQFATHLTRLSAIALGVAAALACGQAHASGFQLKENSAKAQGRALAGAGSASGDTSVVVNNPAVMSTFTQTTAQVDVTAVDLSFNFSGGGSAAAGSPLARPLTGGNGGNAGGVTPVPAMSFVMPLSGGFENVTLGAMISAPFGLKTEYERDWVGRYHAVESDVRLIDLTLAASIDLSDTLSVGAGVVYEHAEITLSNAIDFGTAICANPASTSLCFLPNPIQGPYGPQRNDGFVNINGTDNSFGWVAGINWRPSDRLSLGYSYRSEIDLEIRGTADFTVPGSVRAVLGSNVFKPGNAPGSGGGADLTTPSLHNFSATYQATDRLAVMAEASLTGWDSLREIRIQFENPAQPDSAEDYLWSDTWFYSVGGEYELNDQFTLRAGLAMDSTPVDDQYRTPRLPDQDRRWYSLGLTWAANEHFEVSASYVKVDLTELPPVDIFSSTGARLVGEFDGGANLFGVAAQYRF